jgi:hypothetical protein
MPTPHSVLSFLTNKACVLPQATVLTSVAICIGVVRTICVPSASWPYVLSPTAQSESSVFKKKQRLSPGKTDFTPVVILMG